MDIVVPQGLWDADSVGVLSTWFFENGDRVGEGVVVAEVMSEKVSFEVLAPADGVLELGLEIESEVQGGDVIGRIIGYDDRAHR